MVKHHQMTLAAPPSFVGALPQLALQLQLLQQQFDIPWQLDEAAGEEHALGQEALHHLHKGTKYTVAADAKGGY